MNRVRFLGFLAGALAVVALGLPASAFAANAYTWDLASDFTATGGANPGHDLYGGAPWTYLQGSTDSLIPGTTTFSLLPNFGANVQGGLSAWSASTDGASGPLVGVNPTGAPISSGNSTFKAKQAVVEPGASNLVAVGWTSPFGETVTVSVNGSLNADSPGVGPCTGGAKYSTTWSVLKGGTVLASGALSPSNPNGSFSPSTTVAPGATIRLTVQTPPADATCDATGLTFDVKATAPPLVVTINSPATGSSSTDNTPTFAGSAGNDFGDASPIRLRVYSGRSASGTPVQTVTVPRSGAGWAATLNSPLPLGTYTARAEQDDAAGDVWLSAPVTFTVRVPAITLNSFGSRPLGISTPAFTGTADTDPGADAFVVVDVFGGTAATGTPVLTLTTSRDPSGQFSAPVTSALGDGVYTAVAAQGDSAGYTGFSAPQTFSVDTQAPVVTLLSPGTGSRLNPLQLVFSGAAGGAPFDADVVTVSVYKGTTASGTPLAKVKGKVSGSNWSAPWPASTTALPRGNYTALASQTDAVGHVGTSTPHTFQVLPLPPVVGSVATINRAGRVSVKIACNEPSGDTCSGTVLVLTRGEFQPLRGGPIGHLTVMFAYVHIPGGQTATVTRTALAPVATVLRRHATVKVTISATLHPRKGKAIHATIRADLRRTRK